MECLTELHLMLLEDLSVLALFSFSSPIIIYIFLFILSFLFFQPHFCIQLSKKKIYLHKISFLLTLPNLLYSDTVFYLSFLPFSSLLCTCSFSPFRLLIACWWATLMALLPQPLPQHRVRLFVCFVLKVLRLEAFTKSTDKEVFFKPTVSYFFVFVFTNNVLTPNKTNASSSLVRITRSKVS